MLSIHEACINVNIVFRHYGFLYSLFPELALCVRSLSSRLTAFSLSAAWREQFLFKTIKD